MLIYKTMSMVLSETIVVVDCRLLSVASSLCIFMRQLVMKVFYALWVPTVVRWRVLRLAPSRSVIAADGCGCGRSSLSLRTGAAIMSISIKTP